MRVDQSFICCEPEWRAVMEFGTGKLRPGVGVGVNMQKPYWLIKNSWDYTWGDSGYFRIEAFKNMCGVADCNSFPDLYGA